jgi:hypothetical protein
MSPGIYKSKSKIIEVVVIKRVNPFPSVVFKKPIFMQKLNQSVTPMQHLDKYNTCRYSLNSQAKIITNIS